MLHLQLGTLSSWITAGGIVALLGVVLKFLPEWTRARIAEKVSDTEIAKKLRDELFARLNECEARHNKLEEEYRELLEVCRSQEKRIILLEEGDRRKTIALSLLMNEIHRLDPESDIILRAKGVLELSINLTPAPHDDKADELLHKLDNYD